jgi:hypothetical protein
MLNKIQKIIIGVVALVVVFFAFQFFTTPEEIKLGAPSYRIERTIFPETDSAYDLGTTTKRWRAGYFDTIDATSFIGIASTTDLLYLKLDQSTPQTITGVGLKLTAGMDIRPSADSTTAINIAQADGTDFVTFDTTNKRVGIGTTPATRLHIVGTSETPTGSYFGIMKIDTSTGTNDTGFKMGALAGAGTAGYGFIQAVHTNVANDGNLALNPSGGNVGIGTTGPAAPLDVRANASTFATLAIGAGGTSVANISDNADVVSGMQMGNMSTGTAADFRFLIKDTTGHYFAFAQPGVNNSQTLFGLNRKTTDYIFNSAGTARDMVIGTADEKDLIFGTKLLERMRILGTTGNVGIGTTAPSNIFNVSSGYAKTDTTERNIVAIGSNEALASNPFHLMISNTGAALAANRNANIYTREFGVGTSGSLSLQGTGGNVGIGTTAPTAVLHLKAGTTTASTAPLKFTTGTLLGTPEAGAMEFVDGKFYVTGVAKQKVLDRSGDVKLDTTTVTNTTNETTVYTADIGVNSLRAGNVLHLDMSGTIDEAAASDAVTIRVKVGGVTMATVVSPASGIAAKFWHITGYATIRSVGATGSMAWHLDMNADTVTTEAGGVSTIDTTTAENITVTAQWNAAKAGNIFTCTQGLLEYKN